MLSIKFESSERGDSLNWVKEEIIKNDLDLLAFEGYTVKDDKVSLLLDRGCLNDECEDIDEQRLFETLNSDSSFNLQAKVELSDRLNCSYVFLCYSYINEKTELFEIDSSKASRIASFETRKAFGEWTMQFRDLVMSSQYEESGLPKIDKDLRALKLPWPGNLDYALLKKSKPTALIEFQRTSKAPVQKHCNNTWFLPSGYRKGDVNRWLAIDIIRKQSGLPLFIIVWSTKEEEVKLKLVDKIVYPKDPEPKKGLIYKKKEVMSIDRMIEILNRY